MGCASSKHKRCKNCNAPYSPVPRSYSMHVHHPPQTEGDTYHVVALTSTTLGTLKLNSPVSNHHDFVFPSGNFEENHSFRFDNCSLMQKLKEEKEMEKSKAEAKAKAKSNDQSEKVKEFSMGLIEAKTWSNMIEQKITKVVPKTPTRTPPGEPETINTWELMEGLEDITPYRSPNHFRSFSFDVNSDVGVGVDDDDDDDDLSKSNHIDSSPKPKPMWLHMTEEEEEAAKLNPAISDFDPEIISSFRMTLQQLSPESPYHLRPSSQIDEEKLQGSNTKTKEPKDVKLINGKDNKVVVLYFTSLRGVRKTYEDCCQVRMILRGLGVKVDERDVSMHSGFKEELRELQGRGLPRVFFEGNHIGGAEEIQRLHEDGKLEKLLEDCEKIEEGACEACGDIRFIPCETCFGSCKIYYEEQEHYYDAADGGSGGGDVDEESNEYGFQRCPDCNENGLIRCPLCCF